MGFIKNILFVMADQLRWDYLSCYGHPALETPNIDGLASKGVRFDRAYVQSPVCGPSRASYYTGRTAFSHGATWNNVPLPIGERTIGDYLRPSGIRTAVVGKTHMNTDRDGMARFGLTRDTQIGLLVAEPGFDPYERDDGLHPTKLLELKGGRLDYNDWLRERGYDCDNPWNDYANAAQGPNGEVLSGWDLRNSAKAARIAEEHSETAYMTGRAMDFIRETGDTPWFCHLSYIKPHWPYIAPAPYHAMYSAKDFKSVHRSEKERENPHPVYQAFMNHDASRSFSQDEVRNTVLVGYMGLIKQIDDHLGRLFQFLEESGRSGDTMIVFASDHGDYMGDHWLGEKELFHDESARVPLVVYDPRPAADSTRGTTESRMVEAIDLLPTFLDATGSSASRHWLEGRSLMPALNGDKRDWREDVFSEIDYAFYQARQELDLGPSDARGYMIRTNEWKYIYFKGFGPQLFDLSDDPDEFIDLGESRAHDSIRAEMKDRLFDRLIERRNRVAMTDEKVLDTRDFETRSGIQIGRW